MAPINQPIHGGNLAWAAQLSGTNAAQILDFSASINPLGPPSSAIAAIQSSFSCLRAYPDPDYSKLRQALSQIHGLPADWILPGNGSAELLTWASRELAQLNTTYVMTPAFSDYGRSLRAFDAQVVSVPMQLTSETSWELSIEHLLQRIKGDRPKWGLILNTPHNPTGQLIPLSTIQQCLDVFDLVIVDEAFMDFLPPDQAHSVVDWVEHYPNLVILRSLTKFYSLPGLRIGYAIAHPDRLHRWQQWRDPWPVNGLAEAAAIASLSDHSFQTQTWAWLPPARSHLFHSLAALPGLTPYPGTANFLLVHCQQSAVELQHQLLKHHQILIRDCVSFPELGDRHFRVAIRTQTDNQKLIDGLGEKERRMKNEKRKKK